MKKRISAVIASCLLLGSMVLPVQAEEMLTEEAYSSLPQEARVAAVSEMEGLRCAVREYGREHCSRTVESGDGGDFMVEQ